jgi:hypothetical protein
VSGNLFQSHALRFSLSKPDSWAFLPPAWSPVAQLKNSGDESWAWIQNANQPFCVARRLHDSQRHAFPTLQATVRPFGIPTPGQRETLLQMQLEVLRKTYEPVDILEASASLEFSGHSALGIRAILPLFTEVEGEQIELKILSRVHVIFAPGRAFSVGISTSVDPDFFDEPEIAATLDSIRIDS